MSLVWQVRLAEQAELDLLDIVVWTAEKFGARQAESYAQTLTLAIEVLHDGPNVPGAKARDDIGSGIRTLHVARDGGKGRHFVVFTETEGRVIDVLRLLHDSMDLARHLDGPANDIP
jgi:toxin ParE1/3/4